MTEISKDAAETTRIIPTMEVTKVVEMVEMETKETNKTVQVNLHCLGLPHTITNSDYNACAFTQKVLKFCKMMYEDVQETETDSKKDSKTRMPIKKYRIIHYGHEKSKVLADEHVTVTDDAVLKQAYGDYDWRSQFFKHHVSDYAHQTFYKNTIIEIGKRKQRGDFILCFWGIGHKTVAECFKDECIIVEPGVGCPEHFAPFCVYESYAIMHIIYGKKDILHGRSYDCVIPNYFDCNEFEFSSEKEDYFLFMGRICAEKGLGIVIELAKMMKFRLLIAGQGSVETLGYKVDELPENIVIVGYADMNKRKQLMSKARAVFVFTQYMEPFGGVACESMLSGTPVITSDWGVFNETVLHGVTGFRCRNVDQLTFAVNNIHTINPNACREWVVNNYSLKRVKLMFDEYFDMLKNVWNGKGYYQLNPQRKELDWLCRYHP